MARIGFCLVRMIAALGVGAVLNATGANAQLIDNRTAVSLTMAPTDRLAARQVYPIAASAFLRELERALTGFGVVVGASREANRLIVDVLNYDSGPYIGFTKTARIAVGYRLESPAGVITSWDDRCEAKAAVDVQDSPDRNRTAVSMCLTALGARLAEKLVGPSAEVMVR